MQFLVIVVNFLLAHNIGWYLWEYENATEFYIKWMRKHHQNSSLQSFQKEEGFGSSFSNEDGWNNYAHKMDPKILIQKFVTLEIRNK